MKKSKKRILIVDDYKWGLISLSGELTACGFDVTAVENPSALKLPFKSVIPDLVIMEVVLRNLDGLELLWKIRNHHYNLPVIVWTCFGFLKRDKRVMAADYFLVKSSCLDGLLRDICRSLQSGAHAMNHDPVHRTFPNTSGGACLRHH